MHASHVEADVEERGKSRVVLRQSVDVVLNRQCSRTKFPPLEGSPPRAGARQAHAANHLTHLPPSGPARSTHAHAARSMQLQHALRPAQPCADRRVSRPTRGDGQTAHDAGGTWGATGAREATGQRSSHTTCMYDRQRPCRRCVPQTAVLGSPLSLPPVHARPHETATWRGLDNPVHRPTVWKWYM